MPFGELSLCVHLWITLTIRWWRYSSSLFSHSLLALIQTYSKNPWSVLCQYKVVCILQLFFSLWRNHIACIICCLDSVSQHNYFEIHPSLVLRSIVHSFSVLGKIALYGYTSICLCVQLLTDTYTLSSFRFAVNKATTRNRSLNVFLCFPFSRRWMTRSYVLYILKILRNCRLSSSFTF